MNKNIIKIALITAIMFFGVFFTNIDSAKAIGKPDDKGYAECWYDWSVTTTTGVMSKSRNFLMAITVFRNTDGNYDGYAVTGCGENDITSNNINANKCTLKNYNSVFNVVSSSVLKEKFKNQLTGEWQCPAIYIKSQANSNDVELSWNEKGGFKKIPDRGSSVSDKSRQSGKPTLNNDTINDINPYTKDENGDYDKNQKTADIQDIIDWGNPEKNPDNEYKPESADCEALQATYDEGKSIRDFLNNLLWIISIIGVVLLIVMTAIEFIKVVTGQDDSGLIKAFKHTIIRIVCVIILLLLPVIIMSIVKIVNENSLGAKIGADGQVLCGVGEK